MFWNKNDEIKMDWLLNCKSQYAFVVSKVFVVINVGVIWREDY